MKTAKTDRQKAIQHIKHYLSVFEKNETFYGLILSRYVKEKIGRKDMNPDTVLRYMRELRAKGELSYKFVNKKESTYIKL